MQVVSCTGLQSGRYCIVLFDRLFYLRRELALLLVFKHMSEYCKTRKSREVLQILITPSPKHRLYDSENMAHLGSILAYRMVARTTGDLSLLSTTYTNGIALLEITETNLAIVCAFVLSQSGDFPSETLFDSL